MTNSQLPVPAAPIVTLKGTRAFANSRDVAEFFGKMHGNLLRDIDGLIAGGVLSFDETPYIHPQNGQKYRTFDMTKNGFTFLVMGFTGPEAARFKEVYIAAFDELEALHCVMAPARPSIGWAGCRLRLPPT